MFFGFSYGEVIVTVAVLAVVIGPKELPIMAKMAGRITGQAAAFLSRSRSHWQKFAEENEIAQLHREMQDSLGQLRAIQNELRFGPQMMNPGPLTQRALRLPQQGLNGRASVQSESPSPLHTRSPLGRGTAAGALDRFAAEEPVLAQRLASMDPQLLQALQEHLAKGTPRGHTAPSVNTTGSGAHRSASDDGSQPTSSGRKMNGSEEEGVAGAGGFRGREAMGGGVEVASRGFGASGLDGRGGGGRGNETSIGGVLPGIEADGGAANASALPVSAVAMGLAPQRSGEGTPSGSDIATDALAEEKVARMAQRFFEQQRTQPNV